MNKLAIPNTNQPRTTGYTFFKRTASAAILLRYIPNLPTLFGSYVLYYSGYGDKDGHEGCISSELMGMTILASLYISISILDFLFRFESIDHIQNLTNYSNLLHPKNITAVATRVLLDLIIISTGAKFLGYDAQKLATAHAVGSSCILSAPLIIDSMTQKLYPDEIAHEQDEVSRQEKVFIEAFLQSLNQTTKNTSKLHSNATTLTPSF